MNWTLLQPASAVKKSLIGLKLVIPEKRGKPSLWISVPTTISGKLGFDAEGVERVNVYMGDAGTENAGMMKVEPFAEGAVAMRRLKHAIVITVPAPAGLKLEEESAELAYNGQAGGGFTIGLPVWATPGGNPDIAPSKAAGEKPAALEFNGNIMILGGRELRLTDKQSQVMQRLAKDFGKCVHKKTLLHELYSDDPNGGADDKVIDVMICKIRDLLEKDNWPLIIQTHWGKGYELRRATT